MADDVYIDSVCFVSRWSFAAFWHTGNNKFVYITPKKKKSYCSFINTHIWAKCNYTTINYICFLSIFLSTPKLLVAKESCLQ